jgi:hypothetical protein
MTSYSNTAKQAILPSIISVTNMEGDKRNVPSNLSFIVQILGIIDNGCVLYTLGTEEPIPYDAMVSNYALPGKETTFFAIPLQEIVWTVMKDSVLNRHTHSRLYSGIIDDEFGQNEVLLLQPKKSYDIFIIKKKGNKSSQIGHMKIGEFNRIRIEDILLLKFVSLRVRYTTTNNMNAVYESEYVTFTEEFDDKVYKRFNYRYQYMRKCQICNRTGWDTGHCRSARCEDTYIKMEKEMYISDLRAIPCISDIGISDQLIR